MPLNGNLLATMTRHVRCLIQLHSEKSRPIPIIEGGRSIRKPMARQRRKNTTTSEQRYKNRNGDCRSCCHHHRLVVPLKKEKNKETEAGHAIHLQPYSSPHLASVGSIHAGNDGRFALRLLRWPDSWMTNKRHRGGALPPSGRC